MEVDWCWCVPIISVLSSPIVLIAVLFPLYDEDSGLVFLAGKVVDRP